MKTEDRVKIKDALFECQTIIEQIRKSINSGECNNCGRCKYIGQFNQKLVNVVVSIKDVFPSEYKCLMEYLPRVSTEPKVNPYDFGGILALINIINIKTTEVSSLSSLGDSLGGIPIKVFISHSSRDKDMVDLFIDKVLRLGCGLQPQDILCTSIESTGIKTGTDIRNYLRKVLKSCDYAFFMISDNYIKSSICLNEMGGAWILNKDVKPFLFPKSDFKKMGWLYEISKGSKLDNDEALDELRDELLDRYKLIAHPKTSDWSAQKKKFILGLNSIENSGK